MKEKKYRPGATLEWTQFPGAQQMEGQDYPNCIALMKALDSLVKSRSEFPIRVRGEIYVADPMHLDPEVEEATTTSHFANILHDPIRDGFWIEWTKAGKEWQQEEDGLVPADTDFISARSYEPENGVAEYTSEPPRQMRLMYEDEISRVSFQLDGDTYETTVNLTFDRKTDREKISAQLQAALDYLREA